ncbi:MAG: DNA repair protein RecO [Dehalococcoidia bacterium]|nr:DNA repair protein RecO [Dehalococcoidia bacterium]
MSTRPRSYNTEGVILRRRNLGEADSIFTVFSPTEGKFDAIARAVRKPKSRMRGHLEPLTRSQMHLAHGRNLDVFTQAETIAAYLAVRDDLDRLTLAIYCCELVDRFTVDRAAQSELYDLLVDLLEALDAGASPTVARYFELRVLANTGYEIRLSHCAICDGPIAEEDTLFSVASGGLVCGGCRSRGGSGRLISVRAIKAMRFAANATMGQFAGLRLEAELEAELQRVLGEAIRSVLERETNSGRYVEALAVPLRPPVHESPGDVQ